MNEHIINYLHKRVLMEEYFANNKELSIFRNIVSIDKIIIEEILTDETDETFETIFYNDNLILSKKQIEQLKNITIPYVDEKNNFGAVSSVLYKKLCNYENRCIDWIEKNKSNTQEKINLIDKYESNTQEKINWSKTTISLYKYFIFEKIGIELLKKTNNVCGFCVKKYILDNNKKTGEHVYFDNYYTVYIENINKQTFGYNFFWISKSNIHIHNNKILELLQNKFPKSKFKINSSYSVNTLYFIPFGTNYNNFYYKVKKFLNDNNIDVSKNCLLSISLD